MEIMEMETKKDFTKELKENKKVYVVTVSYDYHGDYYPDDVFIYGVVSTKEKAENLVSRLYDELHDSEALDEVKFFEMTLDELPEKRNSPEN